MVNGLTHFFFFNCQDEGLGSFFPSHILMNKILNSDTLDKNLMTQWASAKISCFPSDMIPTSMNTAYQEKSRMFDTKMAIGMLQVTGQTKEVLSLKIWIYHSSISSLYFTNQTM